LIDREGIIRHIHNGFHGDASEKALVDQVRELLGGLTGESAP
jgi:hypothetical protein